MAFFLSCLVCGVLALITTIIAKTAVERANRLQGEREVNEHENSPTSSRTSE
jgi:hypothetical protein